ncbi:hypothetical protein ENSA5_53250 [Enhygromyxa salina]|uniref:HTTM domain-containing protein n=1 Tax=Enhygromyxa salina TaxID=215803 RepID=A0A2S9XFV0_9BACT|nr:hypothetical protein [Enhygromyxa salina]PRP91744.1 hypothetical protein ENSA5_53250 [Enhygromyxa salina]
MLPLLAKAEYPTAPLDLQIQVGWLVLLCLTLMMVWAWTRSEALRRALFAREDPRMWALFRIGLGLITIQNFWNLNMHWRMLWTDEGLFTASETRSRLARTALSGWTEVDGFLDGWAVLKFFWGKYSLLFIDSDPVFVRVYLAILLIALVLFTIGFRTRITAVLAMLLINSLYNRNAVFLEGHDTVFRCTWFLVLFARTDAAWSVDNWLRRRRERWLASAIGDGTKVAAVPFDWRHFFDRAGHWLWGGLWAWLFCVKVEFNPQTVYMVVIGGISVCAIVGLVERERRRAAAGQGKLTLELSRFQLVAAWPRYLYVAQLVCIYSATGLYKTGSVWKRGDALYYALNMDHFYRFEVVTQWVSVYLATNMFRLMTWVTLYWEKLFALVVIGLILRWRHLHRDTDWYRAMEAKRWRVWLGRAALLGAYAVVYRTITLAYPWCLALQKDKSPTPAGPGLANLNLFFAVVIPVLVVAWFVLGRWPIPIGRLLARVSRGRFASAKIDQEFVRSWVFGRRIWLGLGCVFHGILLVTMNIGMFPVIMMWMYVVFFEAKPFLIAGRWLKDKLRQRKFTSLFAPKLLDRALSEEPGVLETTAQSLRRDPTGPWWLDPWRLVMGPIELLRTRKRDALVTTVERGRDRGGRIPDALVLGLGLAAVGLVVLRGLEAKTDDPGEGATKAEFVADVRDRDGDRDQQRAEVEARKARIERLGDAGHWWVYAGLAIAAASHFRRRPAFDRLPDGAEPEPTEAATTEAATTEPEATKPEAATPAVTLAEPQLIGGTLMRTIVFGFMLYHCGAVGTTFIPRFSVTQAWRSEARKVFGDWVRGTNQSQSWKMFAPNPPRGNGFMRTVVIDDDGKPYQVGKDHYSERPYVFWYNDRERKMHRRMIGKSKWYLRYWGQYHCRDWALNNDGHMPKEVRVFKLRTPIPKPDDLAAAGVASDPRERKLRTELIETHRCDERVVTPIMKQRRGWSLTEEDQQWFEDELERMHRDAEGTRANWAKREDFGGVPREQRNEAVK